MSWNPLSIIGDGLKMVTGSDFGIGNHVDMENQKELMRLRHRHNLEEMANSSALQRGNSAWMMDRMYNAQVSGMKGAGLNPATANGTTPATPSLGAPSSGSSGPSAPVRQQADPLAMAQVRNIDANTKLAEAQAQKTVAETTGQNIENDPEMVWLRKRGYGANIVQALANADKAHSDVQVNNQKIAESLTYQDKMLSEIGLAEAKRDEALANASEVTYKIAERLQNMKESEARITVHLATAKCQRALAGLHEKAAKGLDITNEDLERTLTARKSVTILGDDGRYKSYWGNQAENESKSGAIASDLLEYEIDMLRTMTPAERQKYLMSLDAGHLAIGALNAFTGAASRLGSHSTTTQREYHSGGYWQRTVQD